MKFRIMLLLIPLFLALAAGGAVNAEDRKATPPASPLTVRQLPEFRISRGAVLYQRYCTFCHGETGRGDGLNAYLLPVKPADLGESRFLDARSDRDLIRVIRQGGKETGHSPAMPPFAMTLTPAQAGFLVDYLRTFLRPTQVETDNQGEL